MDALFDDARSARVLEGGAASGKPLGSKVLATFNADELKTLPFPMLSDIKRELSTELGILDQDAGVAQRATYVVDPEGVIRFVYVTDLSVGRSPDEVLRVLDALQTDELCPCNWKKGDDTLKAA